MSNISLNKLKKEKDKIEKIGKSYFDKDKGIEFNKKVKEDWTKETNKTIINNETYILKNLLVILLTFLIIFSALFLVNKYDFNAKEKMESHFILLASVLFSIVFYWLFYYIDILGRKIERVNFNDYEKEQYEKAYIEYVYNLKLKKEDLKTAYTVLIEHFSSEKLYKKMEEVKRSHEEVGSYTLLVRLYEYAILDAKESLNSSEVLGQQVESIINYK